jgi:hypothetical protein
MATLHQHLEATPRRMLLAIARARNLPVPWDAPKAELVTTLAGALLDPAQLSQLIPSLSGAEQAVLDDLVTAGGRLPRHFVVRRHGDLRPYRPWRSDAPRRPWEDPISPVQRLWFLGLIFLDQSAHDLVIPDDVLPHLPVPKQLSPAPAPGQGGDEPALVAAHDLACLLALLQHQDVRPLHGRWLPPRLLAAWGQRCASPPVSQAKGELQTGRRRFLHYLAERAGFVGLAGPYLKPTPAAWLWLEAPPAGRLDALWNAFATPDPALWQTYRLPGRDLTSHPDKLIAAITQTLPDLDPADPVTFGERLPTREPSLYDLLPPDLADAEQELVAAIVEVLTGPLVWLGALQSAQGSNGAEEQGGRGAGVRRRWGAEVISPLRPGSLAPHLPRSPAPLPSCTPAPPLRLTAWGASWLGLAPPPEVPPPPCFALTSTDPDDEQNGVLVFTLTGGLPDPAHVMVLTGSGIRESGLRDQAMFPESPDPDSSVSNRRSPVTTTYHVTAASFARALHQGWSAPALLDALDGLAERPLTGQERATLRAWAEAAERTTIRRLTVLETSDPEVISRLASTRRGRSLIVRTLSPRAVVVDEARLDQLVRRLARQEGVPPAVGSKRAMPTSYPTSYSLLPTPGPSGAAHAWLALKVYQGLGRFIRLPARTPQALLEHLAALADPSGQALAAAETAAEAVLAALQDVMDGRATFPPWPEAGLPVEESLALIEEALANGQALEMDYYTAGRDALTHRVVEPYRLEWRGRSRGAREQGCKGAGGQGGEGAKESNVAEGQGIPYLVGFCHRAQSERVFRLDRIRRIAIVKPDDVEK